MSWGRGTCPCGCPIGLDTLSMAARETCGCPPNDIHTCFKCKQPIGAARHHKENFFDQRRRGAPPGEEERRWCTACARAATLRAITPSAELRYAAETMDAEKARKPCQYCLRLANVRVLAPEPGYRCTRAACPGNNPNPHAPKPPEN